jgi:hypothetical protein
MSAQDTDIAPQLIRFQLIQKKEKQDGFIKVLRSHGEMWGNYMVPSTPMPRQREVLDFFECTEKMRSAIAFCELLCDEHSKNSQHRNTGGSDNSTPEQV